MRGETRMVAMLQYGPGRYDSLHNDLVYGVPETVQVHALREQDLVQGWNLADGQICLLKTFDSRFS